MGVRFYDNKNMSTTTSTSCICNIYNQQTATSPTTNIDATGAETSYGLNNGNNIKYKKSGILREIVGNCKEIIIQDNNRVLRIVGNNNRIRIAFNVGDVTIIGNNTRLKIKTNHGHINYTGNNGRISLGKDSTEKLVDYSGCNGILKVQNSKKSNQANDEGNIKNNTAIRNTSINEKLINKKPKEKYASYSGSPSKSEILSCHQDYYNMFHHKKSMPNIPTKPLYNENVLKNCANQLPKAIVHNFGNIVIANSSNICVSPQSYTY